MNITDKILGVFGNNRIQQTSTTTLQTLLGGTTFTSNDTITAEQFLNGQAKMLEDATVNQDGDSVFSGVDNTQNSGGNTIRKTFLIALMNMIKNQLIMHYGNMPIQIQMVI